MRDQSGEALGVEDVLPEKAEELEGRRVKALEALPPPPPELQLEEGERVASGVGKEDWEAEGVDPPTPGPSQLPLCVEDTLGEREEDTVGARVRGKVGMAEGEVEGEGEVPLEALLDREERGEAEREGEPDSVALDRGLLLRVAEGVSDLEGREER